MKRIVWCAVFLSMLWVGVSHAEMRIWTSKKGDTIEATYVRMFAGGKVVLKTSDGRELKIPVSGLSDKDQKHLASLVPPKLKINADFDSESDTINEFDGYAEKRQVVKGVVDIEKTNMEPCSKTFTIRAYVFAKQMRGNSYWLINLTEKKESFKGTAKNIVFRPEAATVAYTSYSYSEPRGFKYDGYLVVVEDDAGQIVAIDSNRGIYERNWSKIKGAGKGHEFDRDFDRMPKKRTNSYNSYSRNY